MKHLFMSIKKWLSSPRNRGSRFVSWIPFFKGMTWWRKLTTEFRQPKSIIIASSAIFLSLLFILIFRDNIRTFFQSSPGDDPVAYWKLDEGQGTTAFDAVGSNNGTLGTGSSSPTWQSEDECVNGKCLRFDGSNDYVDMDDIFYSDALTVCAWVKFNTLDTHRSMVVKRNSSGTTNGQPEWSLYMENGKAAWASWNDASTLAVNPVGATTLSVGNWNSICGVQGGNGTTAYIYLNGKQDGSDSQDLIMQNTTSRIQVGARTANNDNRFLHGFVDDVKIYSYARSADQIKADYAARGTIRGVAAQFGDDDLSRKLTDGLVGHWKMDESSANTCPTAGADSCDTSGNGNDGTWYGN